MCEIRSEGGEEMRTAGREEGRRRQVDGRGGVSGGRIRRGGS